MYVHWICKNINRKDVQLKQKIGNKNILAIVIFKYKLLYVIII